MTRILVSPSHLDDMAARLRRESESIRYLISHLSGAIGSLMWETQLRSAVEQSMTEAQRLASQSVWDLQAMSQFLSGRAEAFRAADAGGNAGLGAATGPYIGSMLLQPHLYGVDAVTLAAASSLVAMGSMVGVTGADGLTYTMGLGELRRRHPELYGIMESIPNDPFWQIVGTAPVTAGGFSAGFDTWADSFNRRVLTHWKGDEAAAEPYRLTPEKVEHMWRVAEENSVDPRLLLGILWHEGTGSFNTNPANAGAYGGHGPLADFDRDLQGALDGPIIGKLRLYPHAVQAGFTGTWLEWVNWHTPMDTPSKGGAPGVYAQDIYWHKGVESAYLNVVKAVGGPEADPVATFGAWMAAHPERFAPRHVPGEFELRPGPAPGTEPPMMAVWHENEPPVADAVYKDKFRWFRAPEQYCWHLVRKQGV